MPLHFTVALYLTYSTHLAPVSESNIALIGLSDATGGTPSDPNCILYANAADIV